MEVFGVWDERKKSEKGERVSPPEYTGHGTGGRNEEGGQKSGHEEEDEERDEAGFPGDFGAKPDGTQEEAADEEGEDGDAASESEKCCEIEIEPAKNATRREKAKTETGGAVIECDQSECAEGPEDESMGEAGQRALTDNLGLAENLPKEVPQAFSEMGEMKAGVGFGAENALENEVESPAKTPSGCNSQDDEEHLLVGREG